MKKITYLFEFIIIHTLFLIFRSLGYKTSSNFGFFIGKTVGQIFRSKSLIVKNIEKSKIKLKNNSYDAAKNILGNYGRIFAEYPHLKNFRNNKLSKFIKIEGLKYLEKIKNENKPVVFISGHFNNFELMAMQIEKSGINLATIYRPLNNMFLNKTMENIRINYICKKQIKKGRSGTRQVLENLKKGYSIALMVDQRVTEGSKVNFFGNPASTTTIPAQIIKKYKCDLVPIYIERKNKYFFKMYVSEPIKVSSSKNQAEVSLFINKILEKMILKNPDQWIWSHDRWKN